jgi:hypothetical protein
VGSVTGIVDRRHHGADSGLLATHTLALLKAVVSIGEMDSLPPVGVPLVGQCLLHLGCLVGGPLRLSLGELDRRTRRDRGDELLRQSTLLELRCRSTLPLSRCCPDGLFRRTELGVILHLRLIISDELPRGRHLGGIRHVCLLGRSVHGVHPRCGLARRNALA